MKKKFLVTQLGDVRFYAKHQVLRELIRLISQNAEVLIHRRINVFIGIHHWIADSLPKNAFNIGIQTEQFFDANGLKLWGSFPDSYLKAACLKFDVILDFTELNKLAYQNIDKYSRVVFGPYIFPNKKISPSKEKLSDIFFVGALNDRRSKIISALSTKYPIKIIQNEFGEQLNQSVSQSAVILNIHFQDGVYAEWPRILLAYVNGKVVVSEDLGYPLIMGKHYCALDLDLMNVDFAEIHQNVGRDFADNYSFSDFLNAQNGRKIKLQTSEAWYLWWHSVSVRLEKIKKKIKKYVKLP
jgi:hypothetical protein